MLISFLADIVTAAGVTSQPVHPRIRRRETAPPAAVHVPTGPGQGLALDTSEVDEPNGSIFHMESRLEARGHVPTRDVQGQALDMSRRRRSDRPPSFSAPRD
jgi:hypothetical protein